MANVYLPEGYLYNSGENKEYISCLSGLEYARDNGIILEATAVKCDSEHNLHVDFGFCKGLIPREETVYNPAHTGIKDIAIITRVGKKVCFKVADIQTENDETVAVLSRRQAQMECCERKISALSCGDVTQVAVTHMENFGVFCDMGCGVVGLLPIDCISVSRIGHPDERFVCGQIIKCVVKDIERDICRVTLTHKELLGTWEENAALFEPGETACGIVRSVEPYGIFVELTPNLAGLAELCEGVIAGQKAAVYIKSIIPEKMKVKLVIVGVMDDTEKTWNPGYMFGGSHMDEWRYSPEDCLKEVYTLFE